MQVDYNQFKTINVIDTCAIWNILSSTKLFRCAANNGFSFCCTQFVHYECLIKPRKNFTNSDAELCSRLKGEISRKKIEVHPLTIDDLNDIDVLEKRKKLGKGELSSIVFAKKISQAVLTDDQAARKLASSILSNVFVQTTPHLFGCLIYRGLLLDADKDAIISEHKGFGRSLGKFFEETYLMALEHKLKDSIIVQAIL